MARTLTTCLLLLALAVARTAAADARTFATPEEAGTELMAALDRHRARGREAGDTPARLARAEAHVWAILADRLRARLHEPAHAAATSEAMRKVAAHELDPFAAADRLLKDLGEG